MNKINKIKLLRAVNFLKISSKNTIIVPILFNRAIFPSSVEPILSCGDLLRPLCPACGAVIWAGITGDDQIVRATDARGKLSLLTGESGR